MHDAPDPDAIGSALGLAWIIKKLTGVKCEIFHGGPISHPENKSLVNVLSLAFKGPVE
jgi:nanoRNase/pAp phosphatase (c-di-AMP/oligoRNAs hydrolase)